jgi:hypothetical protein
MPTTYICADERPSRGPLYGVSIAGAMTKSESRRKPIPFNAPPRGRLDHFASVVAEVANWPWYA